MMMRGIPQSVHCSEIFPACSSIEGSSSDPKLIWMETASAPYLMASSIVVIWTLLFLLGPRSVEADRCMMSPTSLPD